MTRRWCGTLLLGVVVCAGTQARAVDDPPEEPAGLADRLEPLRDRADLSFAWDDGPTYRIRLAAPELESRTGRLLEHVEIDGRIGMQLFLDGGWISGDGIDEGWQDEVRRFRLETKGAIRRWFDTGYKFAFDIEEGSFFLNDFNFSWRLRRVHATRLRVGYLQPPVSLAALGSGTARGFLETASPVAAFAPGYRAGVELSGLRPNWDVSWAVALTTFGQDQEEGDASDSALRFNGRIVWRPWRFEPSGSEVGIEPSVVHLGASLGATVSGNGDLRYRSRPESRLVRFLIDTDDIDGNAALLALEAAWRRGPLSVQGELFYSPTTASSVGDPTFQGAYLQAAWVLTGEARPYDAADAVFGRIEPRHAFAPRRGHYGALELALRLSWTDLSDADVRGGEMVATTATLCWIWNRHVRVLAGYTWADTRDVVDATTVNVVSTRIEFRF